MLELLKRILLSTLIISLIGTPVVQSMEPLVSSFPKNTKDWGYVRHIDGAGGGVHLFQDPETGQKLVVKSAKNKNHLIEEIVGRSTYEVFGHLVPKAYVLDKTSSSWPTTGQWAELFGDALRVQISEFIEAGPFPSKGKLVRWFDVLFGNLDLADHNYIINKEGTPVPIDFGCFARFRANGDCKVFEDLWSYQFISPLGMIPPDEEELSAFKRRIPTFFETLKDLHSHLNIPDFPSLWYILASRIHSFLTIFDPPCSCI